MIAAFPPRRSSFEIRSLIRKPFHARGGRPAQLPSAGGRHGLGHGIGPEAAWQVAL